MPAPGSDEAPAAPRVAWGVRVGIVVVIALALAGFVLGAVNTVELAVNMLARFHGSHASAVVRSTPRPEVAVPDEEEDEPAQALPATPAARRPAEPPPIVTVTIDAGHDAGPTEPGPAPSRVVEVVIDASVAPTVHLAPCNPDLARRVEAFYAPVSSFRARFDQELFVRALGSGTRSHGSLLVAKPGKMSWSYDDPEDSRIVSDGQTVLVYEAPNKHVFRVPAGSSPYSAAFAFLTGQAPFSLVFDFVTRAVDPGICILSGTPRALTRAFQRVVFLVDRATLQVGRVIIFDRAGDENRIDLSDPVLDAPVDPEQFVFVPPPDTIVVGR